jgi:hypothetical protein
MNTYSKKLGDILVALIIWADCIEIESLRDEKYDALTQITANLRSLRRELEDHECNLPPLPPNL